VQNRPAQGNFLGGFYFSVDLKKGIKMENTAPAIVERSVKDAGAVLNLLICYMVS
jgi:hypothetical protein